MTYSGAKLRLSRWVFKKHKRRVTVTPICARFDSIKSSEVDTDASAVGGGTVLIQTVGDEQGIAYASMSLNTVRNNYGATELELFAVNFAIKKFRIIWKARCHSKW